VIRIVDLDDTSLWTRGAHDGIIGAKPSSTPAPDVRRRPTVFREEGVMSRAAKVFRMGLLPGMVAVALAFGAAQALAAPQDGPAAPSRACVDESCDGSCISRGYSGGVCNPGGTCF
jgi:hypothetical protein